MSSEKKEKEDADKDEEDEEAGHTAKQGLQGDGVESRLDACLWFRIAICHMSKGGGRSKNGVSYIEQASVAFQFKAVSF